LRPDVGQGVDSRPEGSRIEAMAKTDSIIDEVLHLPRESRALLAEKLLESLDNEGGFEVSPEWMDEIKRRCREIDDGTVALSASEKVFEELDSKLG
jgi:putative addiction module component (TIGR02574 family)